MKISIITATYNSAAHIAGCLASVNSQTCKNIEHIIVDGASTDNTLEIIKTTENRVVQLISEPDHGIYGNLVFTNTQNKVVRTWQSKPFHPKNVRHGWMPPHPTLFLRKEVYAKHGLFDTTFKIAGDYDFMLRVMTDHAMHLHYLPEVITRMRVGGASTGSIKGIILKMREDIRALRNNGFRFPLAILAAKNLRKLPQLLHR
jgi:glycosyltransferase